MPVTISLARINWALGLAVLVLTLLGLVSEVLLSVYQEDWAFGLVPLLNLSYETTIATWYASILLLACAGLLACIAWARASQGAPFARHWAILAGLLAYLSVNELVRFHEVINPALADTHHLSGLFAFSWVLPVGALTALFAYAYRGFFTHLSPRFQRWFMIAGALYVGGGLVTEFAISLWYDAHGGGNLVFGLLNLAQVSIQIVGATVLLSASLAYVSTEIGEIRIGVRDDAPPLLKPMTMPKRKPKAEPKPAGRQKPDLSLKDQLTRLAKYLPRY